MRLIDADKLIAFIDVGKYANPNALVFSENDVCEMINEQPTAYDVDRVIEEFERRFKYHLELSNRDLVEHGRAQAYRSAIDIVKRGGVE